MLKITAELKKYANEHLAVAAGADDDTIRKAVSEAVMGGKLDPAKLAELTATKATEAETKLGTMIDERLAKAIAPLTEIVNKAIGAAAPAAAGAPTETKAVQVAAPPVDAPNPVKAYAAGALSADTSVAGEGMVRLKSVVEQFNDSRTTATYEKSSNTFLKSFRGAAPVTTGEGAGHRTLDMPTDRQKAIAGAWFKHLINKQCRSVGREVPWQFRMKELDLNLVQFAVHECKFVGPLGYAGGERDSDNADHWFDNEKAVSELHRKALMDDSTSGGLEAVPIEFDSLAILTPLLNGELFPFVTVRNVSRRRIEAAKIGNPTMSWGVSEGSSVSLFNTDSFISAFDNTIYPITGSMEMGRDFLSDSPLDIGGIIVERYGQVYLQEMDTVIADGNGTNRPEGIFNASGVSTVSSAGGAGAAPQVGDYEALYFNVGKAFRTEAGPRFCYVGTDTAYKRARGIPVDSSNDARRVFGMDQSNYQIFDRPFRIGGATNAKIAGVCLNRYRMYRRAGLEVRIITEDSVLARQNKQMVVLRARFGGSLDNAGAMVKVTDAQA